MDKERRVKGNRRWGRPKSERKSLEKIQKHFPYGRVERIDTGIAEFNWVRGSSILPTLMQQRKCPLYVCPEVTRQLKRRTTRERVVPRKSGCEKSLMIVHKGERRKIPV